MSKSLYERIQTAQKNDNDELYNLIQQFYPTIKKFGKNLNYEEAETDLIIFSITLLRKMNLSKFNYKGDGVLVNYIHSAIKNKSIDIYRKYKDSKNIEMELLTDIIQDESSINFDENITMKLLISDLSHSERTVITELYYVGSKYSDLEKKLQLSRQSIYNTKKRALEKLKKQLELVL